MSQVRPGWLLKVDGALCDGHGICALVCPRIVALDEWGYPIVEKQPIVEVKALDAAKRAVRACPARALSLRAGPHGRPVA